MATTTLSATGSAYLNKNRSDGLAVFQISGTYTTVTFVFEGCIEEGATSSQNWFPVAARRSDTGELVNGTISPTNDTTRNWSIDASGLLGVRLRVTAIAGGSVLVTPFSSEFKGSPFLSINQAGTTSSGQQTYTGSLLLTDSVQVKFGDDSDITMRWDGTDFDVLQATANSSIKWGVSGAGIDHVFYGDTVGYNLTWDQSADALIFNDNAKLALGDSSDIVFLWNNTDLLVSQATADSIIKWGVSGAGINHVFYGDTATYDMTWDQTNDQLLFNDNAKMSVGTGAGGVGDISWSWDATRCNVTQLTANSEIRWGVDGAGIDQMWYGDTASTYMTWDQSDDSLILAGVAKIKSQTITAATGTAIPVTHSGSLAITQNGAETNTLAIPTFLGQWLNIFVDTDTAGARVITSAQRINQAGNTIITMTEVGDFIKLEAITIAGALRWQVVANDGCVLT